MLNKQQFNDILSLRGSGILNECTFKTSRSGGAGGQNVNKVSTKVALKWKLNTSAIFDLETKTRIRNKIFKKLTLNNELIIVSEEHRTQLENKEKCITKFLTLIHKSLEVEIPRKKTKPSKAIKERRLSDKKINKLKKTNRKLITLE